jgi:excinuclease ABC subunit C
LYIDKKSESLRVIQALRDEAHRFGITHHRNRRSHSQVTSELDNIPGVGPATSAALMKAFKSVRRLKMASSEEISAVVGKAKAKIIADYFSTHA